jgi:hypothetical protein
MLKMCIRYIRNHVAYCYVQGYKLANLEPQMKTKELPGFHGGLLFKWQMSGILYRVC